jgi:hypothetical protein
MLDKFRGFLQPENAYDAFGLALLYASLRFYGASSQTAGNTFTCGSGLAVVSPGPAAVVTLSGLRRVPVRKVAVFQCADKFAECRISTDLAQCMLIPAPVRSIVSAVMSRSEHCRYLFQEDV